MAACIVPWALSLIAIGLRFWSRRLSRSRLGWDDWLILITGVISQFQFGIGWWWYSIGGGKYIGDVSVNRLRAPLAIFFIIQMCWIVTIFLVRASVLTLWLRLFTYRWVQYLCWIWQAINVAWAIAAVVAVCGECQPFWAFFDPLQAPLGSCGDVKKQLLAFNISSIVLDAVVLVMPLKVCWGLQLNQAMRLVLCGMFATGSFTIIVTIVRVIIEVRMSVDSIAALNVTWIWAELGYWTVTETNIAIVSACLPCLRPVVSKVVPSSWVSWSTHKQNHGLGDHGKEASCAVPFAQKKKASLFRKQTRGLGSRGIWPRASPSVVYIMNDNIENGIGGTILSSRIPMADLDQDTRHDRTRAHSQNCVPVEIVRTQHRLQNQDVAREFL